MIATDIPRLRKDLHLNQSQFAGLMGIHPITVSRWERGKVSPTPYQWAFLEEFKKAARDETVRKTVAAILITAGLVAAVLLLLQAARKAR
jgi:transcriptional regulator with XRE-family HTH domain